MIKLIREATTSAQPQKFEDHTSLLFAGSLEIRNSPNASGICQTQQDVRFKDARSEISQTRRLKLEAPCSGVQS